MNAMLPRRDDVLGLLRRRGRSLSVRELAAQLEVAPPSLPGFARFVDSLAQEGTLRLIEPDRYAVEVATARGRREPSAPGDTSPRLVGGTLRRRGASSWLEADDDDLPRPLVLRGEARGAEGDAAVARLERYPEFPDENPEGRLVAALGPAGARAAEEAKILRREGLDPATEVVLDEAPDPAGAPAPGAREQTAAGPGAAGAGASAGGEPWPAGDEVPGGWLLDLGDGAPGELAWRVEPADGGGFRATIALARPDRWVEPGDAVDREAQARGRELAWPGRRRPLWPAAVEAASGLRAGEAAACLGLAVRVDAAGALREARLGLGWTRPLGSLDEAALEGAAGGAAGEAARAAGELADRRRAQHRLGDAVLRGGESARVRLRRGEPRSVERHDGGAAGRIAAELAGLVDEAAARWLLERGLVAIFRERGAADPVRLRRFVALAAEAMPGLGGDGDEVLGQELAGLAEHPRGEALLGLLRRALGPVRYGVAATDADRLPPSAPLSSPLRRHADVEVARVIAAALGAEARGERLRQGDDDEARLAEAARLASRGEARAARVEAAALALHGALVMASSAGEAHEGVVTDVSREHVTVALDDPFVEARVPVEGLGPDRYELDPERLRLFGERTGDSVSLGDRLAVEITAVDVSRRRVTARRPAADAGDRDEAPREPPARAPRRPGWRLSKMQAARHATGKGRGR